jgi:hypothetical protein
MCFRKNYRVNMKKGLIFENEPFFYYNYYKINSFNKKVRE